MAEKRIILFCDVERPLKSALITRLNRWVSNNLTKAIAASLLAMLILAGLTIMNTRERETLAIDPRRAFGARVAWP